MAAAPLPSREGPVYTRELKLLQDGSFGVEVGLQPQEAASGGGLLSARLKIDASVGAGGGQSRSRSRSHQSLGQEKGRRSI